VCLIVRTGRDHSVFFVWLENDEVLLCIVNCWIILSNTMAALLALHGTVRVVLPAPSSSQPRTAPRAACSLRHAAPLLFPPCATPRRHSYAPCVVLRRYAPLPVQRRPTCCSASSCSTRRGGGDGSPGLGSGDDSVSGELGTAGGRSARRCGVPDSGPP
jgi:hypothetical protein